MMASALLLLAALTFSTVSETDGIKWTAELDEALRLSQKYHVPVLLHFSSDHCPPCRLLEERAFKSPEVIKAVHEDYIPVMINVDQLREIAHKYKVEQWPTDLLLNSSGEVMHRGVSPQDPKQYVKMLKNGVQKHQEHLALKLEAAKQAAPAVVSKAQSIPVSASLGEASGKPTGSPFSLANSSARNSVPVAANTNQQLLPANTGASPKAQPASQPPQQKVNPFFDSKQAPPIAVAKDSMAPKAETVSSAAVQAAVDPGLNSPMPNEATSREESQETVTVAADEVPPPILDGFCPVSLHEALLSGKADDAWQEGSAQFAVKHRSCIYWLKDEAQLQKFMEDPDKYAAVLSGFDLIAFLREGVLIPGKRDCGFIREGKLFLFSSKKNKDDFAARHQEYVSEMSRILNYREASRIAPADTIQR